MDIYRYKLSLIFKPLCSPGAGSVSEINSCLCKCEELSGIPMTHTKLHMLAGVYVPHVPTVRWEVETGESLGSS